MVCNAPRIVLLASVILACSLSLGLLSGSAFGQVASDTLDALPPLEEGIEQQDVSPAIVPQPKPVGSSSAIRRSRLSRLVLTSDVALYMPTRMIVGNETRFVVKAPAGNKVVLLLSPQSEGYALPNGISLNVGPEHQALEETASDKGVAVFTLPVPDNPQLIGSKVYVDGYTYGQADYSDFSRLTLVDPAGRPAITNKLAIEAKPDNSGALILPGLGDSASILQRLGTLADVQKGGDRVKELVDDGDITDDVLQNNNVFITRPDGVGGLK